MERKDIENIVDKGFYIVQCTLSCSVQSYSKEDLARLKKLLVADNNPTNRMGRQGGNFFFKLHFFGVA